MKYFVFLIALIAIGCDSTNQKNTKLIAPIQGPKLEKEYPPSKTPSEIWQDTLVKAIKELQLESKGQLVMERILEIEPNKETRVFSHTFSNQDFYEVYIVSEYPVIQTVFSNISPDPVFTSHMSRLHLLKLHWNPKPDAPIRKDFSTLKANVQSKVRIVMFKVLPTKPKHEDLVPREKGKEKEKGKDKLFDAQQIVIK